MASLGELKKDFTRLAGSGKLSHSYLLFGPGEGEKFTFAKELAKFLENGKWMAAEEPLIDALFLDGDGEALGIDLIRSLTQFLWQRPIKSPRRTAVINCAGELTLQAQHAILKIAEEPPTHALIILIVKDPSVLLPTITSRLQKIYVRGKSEIQNSKSETISNSQILKFLKADTKARKEILKEVVEDKKMLDNFVSGLIAHLSRDSRKNWLALKELLHRWSLIKQYNVNKRLQLEAWTRFLS